MSQHTLREIQQLKQEVALLKESLKDAHEDPRYGETPGEGGGFWGPGDRDEGVEIDDLKTRVDAIEKRLDRIEHLLSRLGGGGGGSSLGPIKSRY